MTELNNNDIALGIEKTFNISKFIATYLVQHNVKTEEDIYKLLNKNFNLTNPFIIPDFKKAIDRIIFAIKNQEKIIIKSILLSYLIAQFMDQKKKYQYIW